MKNGLLGSVISFLLAGFFLALAPAWSQNIDDRIKAFEQELSELKAQQIELKMEATAAASALPSFSHRPGNGLLMEAEDKSWSFRAYLQAHFRMNFHSGRDQVGRSQGEIMARRFTPHFYYCIDNCLYELDAGWDLDGWGTGTGKNATNTAPGSILQRAVVHVHLENLSPWLPTVDLGSDVSNAVGGSLARQGSTVVGAQGEFDLHTRNNGFITGRAGSGVVLNWDDRSLSPIGIPGRIGRFELSMASIGEGDDGLQSFTDRKDFNTYLSIQPFAAVKNKWIEGLTFEYGAWFCNVDNRALVNGCGRYRVQDHGDGGRQTLFDTGAGSIGDGLHVSHGPGIVWSVGPYTLRSMGYFQRSEDRGGQKGRKKAQSFLIAHDLFVWSPKGLLTGSSNTPGSILVGTHFERVDMSLGCSGTTGIPCPTTGHLAQFHRNRILLREWDLFYFVAPRMSIGINLLWYDASNLRNGANQAAHNLGICKTPVTATNCQRGIGGDWLHMWLNYRYAF